MSVTADRLLRALWKEEGLMLETLSLLSVERIVLPWRRINKAGTTWCFERRSIFGSVVAECSQSGPNLFLNPENPCRYRIVAKSPGFGTVDEGVGSSEAAGKATADGVLNKRGWLVVDLPKLSPWEAIGAGGWARKTSLGDVAAWVKPQAEERRFKTYVILDEQEAEFEGTPTKAMDVVDRNLEHLGFRLG